jgi:hypothetical protein
MATAQTTRTLSSGDEQVVRLLTTALANPTIPIDLRERLHGALTEVLTVRSALDRHLIGGRQRSAVGRLSCGEPGP